MFAFQIIHWIEETFGTFGSGNFIQLSEKSSVKKSGEKLFRIDELEASFQTNRYTDGTFIKDNADFWRKDILDHFGEAVRKFHIEHSDIYLASKDKTNQRVSLLLTISLFRKEEIKGE